MLDAGDTTLFSGACREMKEESGFDICDPKNGCSYKEAIITNLHKSEKTVINFVVETAIKTWTNTGKGRGECGDIPYTENDPATFGHFWVEIGRAKRDYPSIALFLKI
jgi:hypothetical protein